MKSSLSSLPIHRASTPAHLAAAPRKRAARARISVPMPETGAALALVVVGLTHGALAPQAWGDARYQGVLFAANALFSLIFAFNLIRGDRFVGWMGGALVCASSALAYVASRTIGLPALPAQPAAWLEPAGVLSLCAEIGFTLVWMRAFVYGDDKD